MNSGTDEKVSQFSFPTYNDQYDKWISALLNAMNYSQKTVVCVEITGQLDIERQWQTS